MYDYLLFEIDNRQKGKTIEKSMNTTTKIFKKKILIK